MQWPPVDLLVVGSMAEREWYGRLMESQDAGYFGECADRHVGPAPPRGPGYVGPPEIPHLPDLMVLSHAAARFNEYR